MTRTATALDVLREATLDEMRVAGLRSCQYALAKDGEVFAAETLGEATPDSRFLIFSSTKPVVTSVVLQLIGERLLDPASTVAAWWPEFGANGKHEITLEQLMVHTAGLPNAVTSDAAVHDRALRLAEIEGWPPEYVPGTQYAYHGLSSHWVLAELIERVTGLDHVSALRQRVLDPLELRRLELGVPHSRQGDIRPIARVGGVPTPGEIEDLLGIPLQQLPAAAATPTGGPDAVDLLTPPHVLAAGIPGGGAVSDAGSLAIFYQHLIHNSHELWDPAVLSDAKNNVRNRLPDTIGRAAFRTLAFEIAGDDRHADLRIGAGATSPGTFGHSGAGGQVAWADPLSGLSFAFLTDTFDANFVRLYRRAMRVTRLAAACVP